MNLLIVSASQQNDSNSIKLANYLTKNVLSQQTNIRCKTIDLSKRPWLLDNYGVAKDVDKLTDEKSEVLEKLYWCDAVIFVVPEWGGMTPPALVNLLLLTAYGSAQGLPLGHKPGFIIGVSASGGGSNPVTLLKGYAGKNSHICWLSMHAVVQNVDSFLETDWQPGLNTRISQVQSRIKLGIDALLIYAKQLSSVRQSLVELTIPHPYGQ